MRIKQSILICFVIALVLMTIGTAAAVTYNVTSIAGPQNYTTIQQAVDNATAGDTILVYPGTYNENVNVTKQLNITSTDGAASTYVTAATSGNHVFNVTADWVTISGFNITGATASDKAGIYLNSSNNSMLISNTASNNSIGILLTSSSYNNLTSNTATDNTQSGIQLAGSPFIGGPSSYNILTDNTATNNSIGIQLGFASYNNLTSNTASNNTGDGISLSGIPFGPFGGPSSYNDLTNNTASNNTGDGINLLVSSNNKLTDNTASNNSIGINLFVSRYNNLTSNTATDNTGDGISLSGIPFGPFSGPSSYNILTDNTATDNTGDGIQLGYAFNNILTDNTASNNIEHGINLLVSSNNMLTSNTASNNTGDGISLNVSRYNNLTSNTASDNTGDGIILAGTPIGGPFSGPSSNNILTDNTATDNTGDGISLNLSSYNNLISNTVSDNGEEGIVLRDSSNNTLVNNTASNNDNFGIYLNGSSNNLIYINHFNNTNNVLDDSMNIWNSTEMLYYTYDGSNYYENYTGNYYSDYSGADNNGDGIGDTPYEGRDNYPLMDWPITYVQPPVADANGPYVGDEGSSITFNGSGSTDPNGVIVLYKWDLDDDGEFDDGTGVTVPNIWYDDYSGAVSVKVTDEEGASDIDTTTVTVNNVAPNITSLTMHPSEVVKIDTEINLTATFTDPGSQDTHTYTIDWGDGNESATLAVGVRAVDANHTYATTGLYNVTLTVEDDELDSDIEFKYVIVCDPDGGSVAGRGSFDSLADAYVDELDLKGMATFEFDSKYKKGVPTGETQFEFEDADLKFQSDSYYWMVVEGHKATYKGNGTVNGEDDYEFLVSVIDEDDDLFRIKIWNATTVIYDNNIGIDGDYADPITEIEKGKIRIKT